VHSDWRRANFPDLFMIIRTIAYPRAGLIGNPSDGYFGKTIAFAFRNYSAQIELWESPELELLPSRRDHSVFESIAGLHQDVKQHGYYGGFRLLKATVKAFFDYCTGRGIKLDNRNFTLRYKSDIPNRVGLAGSSAIITACARALMGFYNVSVSRHSLANLVLSIENRELGIPAGLQDRVAQAYQGLIYMDFDRAVMEARGYGRYEALDLNRLPPTYVAFQADLSEGTEVYHNDVRARWVRGDADVIEAMKYWADLTTQFREAFLKGDRPEMHRLINANFDKRTSLYDVGDGNRDMVATARRMGASANFAGSGGAIVGIYEDEAMFRRLEEAFARKGICVVKPDYAPPLPPTTATEGR
jgi:glucuronokinase